MAQNVTVAGASFQDVPAVNLPITGGGTASFLDTSDADATANDIRSGKTGYVNGSKVTGTAQTVGHHVYFGSKVISVTSTRTITVWNVNTFLSTFHVDTAAHAGHCYVDFVNGDYGANAHIITSTNFSSSNGWQFYLDGNAASGNFRVNYIVAVPDDYSTV